MNETRPQPDGAKQLGILVFAHYLLAVLTVLKAVFLVPFLFPGWELMHHVDPRVPLSGFADSCLESIVSLTGDPSARDEAVLLGAVIFVSTAALVALSVIHGAAIAYIGRCIRLRRRRTLVLVFAWFDLMYLPLGTLLSVFVIVLLRKPHIQPLYSS